MLVRRHPERSRFSGGGEDLPAHLASGRGDSSPALMKARGLRKDAAVMTEFKLSHYQLGSWFELDGKDVEHIQHLPAQQNYGKQHDDDGK